MFYVILLNFDVKFSTNIDLTWQQFFNHAWFSSFLFSLAGRNGPPYTAI